MRHLFLLLRTELKCAKKRRTWVLPLVLVLILFGIGTFSYIKNQNGDAELEDVKTVDFSEEKYIRIGVANYDTSEYAALLLSYFKDSDTFSAFADVIVESEYELKQKMQQGTLDCILVVPENFANSMIDMEHLPVHVTISMENPTKAVLIKTALKAYETYISSVEVNCAALYDRMKQDSFSYEDRNRVNVEISMDLVFTALGKDTFFQNKEVELQEQAKPDMKKYYIASFVYVFFLLAYFSVGLKLKEKIESRIAGRMMLGNINAFFQVAVYLIPYVCLTFLGMLVLVLYGERMEMGLETIVCYTFLLIPVMLLYAFCGVLFARKQTYLLTGSILLAGISILGGGIIPVQYLPEEFLVLTSRLPNYLMLQHFSGGEMPMAQEKILSLGCVATLVLFSVTVLLFQRRGEAGRHEE